MRTPRSSVTAAGAIVAALALAIVGIPSAASAALDASGHEIVVWGDNGNGQSGTGESGNTIVKPRHVKPGGLTFVSIATGLEGTSFGLLADGSAYAWGNNSRGQFGIGTETSSVTPVPFVMPSGSRFTHFTVGDVVVLALDTEGGVWGWGQNAYGILGPLEVTDLPFPTRIAFPEGVRLTKVVVSELAAYAIDTESRIWAWGSNLSGELGQPASVIRETAPRLVPTPEGVVFTDFEVGGDSVFATTADGRLYAWGLNLDGQLGISTDDGATVPEIVYDATKVTAVDGKKVAQISTSGAQTLALLDTGVVHAWGGNAYGELGIGAVGAPHVEAVTPHLPAGERITRVVAGYQSSYAVTESGLIYSWGYNGSGALGDGTTTDRHTPGLVLLPEGTKAKGLDVTFDTAFASVTVAGPEPLPGTGSASEPLGGVALGALVVVLGGAMMLVVLARRRREG